MRTGHPLTLARWVVACAAAETIGMTASAVAARVGHDVADGGDAGAPWLALGVVVAGGLVEGVALGSLQGRVLAGRWPALSRLRFLVLTVAVAGIGWAAASAPSVLAGDDGGGDGPALGLILLGAVGIGLVMGPLLGVAQVLALRGAVAHPWRWVAANTAAWPLAMAVIFTGASTAGADWSTPVVAGYGALTGALAGAALGLVSGAWLGSLDGQPMANRVALALVAGRRLGMHRRLVGLAVRGRRTGRVLRFPVQYAVAGEDLVVVPGHADRKSWWRNLREPGTAVDVLFEGRWVTVRADLVTAGGPGYEAAVTAYQRRWPHSDPTVWEPVVVLRGVAGGIPASSRGLESVGWTHGG
jgi:hypothetical protein